MSAMDAAAEVERMAALYGESPRTLPRSIDAEQAVIGGLLLVNDALPQVSAWLSAEDFHSETHRAIYAAMLEFAGGAEPKPFDVLTLGEWFDANGRGEMVQGGAYLLELASTTHSAANLVAHAEIVREKAQLRRIIDAGQALVDAGLSAGGRRSGEIAMEATSALLGMTEGAKPRGPRTMREIGRAWFEELQARHERGGGMVGLATPWAKLNRLTLGLCPGDLIIVAGRPSMGKSAVAVNLATSASLSGKRVMFFNLEMTDTSIFSRCIASIANVPLGMLRAGLPKTAPDEYWAATTDAFKRMRDADLVIDDTPGLAASQIVARAKREHMRRPLGMIIVDHLHLLKLAGGDRTDREIGEATAALKNLGKALGCPVVLLSQLNRGLESRTNKRPQMQDLRESGAIEQDADLILFLYRDDYYAEREGRASDYPGFVEMFIAKQREGEAGGTVWLRDRLDVALLEDCDEEPARPVKPARAASRKMPSRVGGKDAAAGDDE